MLCILLTFILFLLHYHCHTLLPSNLLIVKINMSKYEKKMFYFITPWICLGQWLLTSKITWTSWWKEIIHLNSPCLVCKFVHEFNLLMDFQSMFSNLQKRSKSIVTMWFNTNTQKNFEEGCLVKRKNKRKK
jgi:hypothetical protein